MKILIIQERERNPDMYRFREALSLQRAFKKIKVDSTVFGLNYPDFASSTTYKALEKSADAIILLENYENTTKPWIPDLSKSSKLKIFWAMHSHVNLYNHVGLAKKHKIDLVLCSIESFQHHFPFAKTEYLPNAVDHELIKPANNFYKERKHNLGFCGNTVNENRECWLKHLDKKYGIKKNIGVYGKSMTKAIRSYWIHWNRNIGEDINLRTFETLACKTVLFTNHTENIDTLFSPGKDLVVYKDSTDFEKKFLYMIENPDEMHQMADNGYEHVIKNHTYIQRAITIKKIIENAG